MPFEADIEEPRMRLSKGLRILTLSLAFGFAGVLPLLLYVAVGPKDGNPIGLGLLALLVVPVAALGVLVGLIWLAIDRFSRRGR